MIALAAAALVIGPAPWYPGLLLLVLGLGLAATRELLQMLGPERRPWPALAYASVALLLLANWPPHLLASPHGAGRAVAIFPSNTWPHDVRGWTPAHWQFAAFTLVIVAAFLAEMASFRSPGRATERIGLLLLVASYLGWLPGFLVQLRWLDDGSGSARSAGAWALALAVFVPKAGDIGAYLTGRFLGRHLMTPVLSPKKTWEGAIGGLAGAVVVAVGLGQARPQLFDHGIWSMIGFGLALGLAGIFGDLAESLLKRDCQIKDSSHTVPGFGGILDVIDAILFAGPVAYAWLH